MLAQFPVPSRYGVIIGCSEWVEGLGVAWDYAGEGNKQQTGETSSK